MALLPPSLSEWMDRRASAADLGGDEGGGDYREGMTMRFLKPPIAKWRTTGWLSLLLTSTPVSIGGISAQTFVQLTDLGSGIGPRLSTTVTQAQIHQNLFGAIGAKVSFITTSGAVYEFASDRHWRRVDFGQMGQWIHSVNLDAGPRTDLRGLEMTARQNLYVTDPGMGRITTYHFDPTSQSLTFVGTLTSPGFPKPADVAWDGLDSPVTQEYLYVLDDSLGTITYFNFNSYPNSIQLLWTYGSTGTGTGQFERPSGICVGKTPATT